MAESYKLKFESYRVMDTFFLTGCVLLSPVVVSLTCTSGPLPGSDELAKGRLVRRSLGEGRRPSYAKASAGRQRAEGRTATRCFPGYLYLATCTLYPATCTLQLYQLINFVNFNLLTRHLSTNQCPSFFISLFLILHF
jgi:hypothetical protein